MEVRALQKKIALRLVVYTILLGAAIALCIYLNGLKDSSDDKLSKIKNDIASLNRKLQGLSKQAVDFSEAVKTWESIDEKKKSMQGLRINYAKDLMDRLEEKYYLSGVSVTFSKPEEVKDDFKTNTVSVIASVVNIKFSAVSDAHMFNFIDELIDEYPGYIQIESFSTTRNQNVTKNIIREIASGGKPALLDGKIDLVWRGLEYKGPMTSDDEGAQ